MFVLHLYKIKFMKSSVFKNKINLYIEFEKILICIGLVLKYNFQKIILISYQQRSLSIEIIQLAEQLFSIIR